MKRRRERRRPRGRTGPGDADVRGIGTLTGWWRGDHSLAEARAEGLIIEGRSEWVRAFPRWFERYLFASVGADGAVSPFRKRSALWLRAEATTALAAHAD